MSDYGFKPLPLGQRVEFSLTPSSPTLTIDDRRSHFAGFSVPAGVQPTAVVVSTYLSTGFLPKATAVVPQLVFYDDGFNRIGEASPTSFQDDRGFWRGSVSARLTVPLATRYVVVVPGTGASGRVLARSENGTPYLLPPAALGDVAVRLFGLQGS